MSLKLKFIALVTIGVFAVMCGGAVYLDSLLERIFQEQAHELAAHAADGQAAAGEHRIASHGSAAGRVRPVRHPGRGRVGGDLPGVRPAGEPADVAVGAGGQRGCPEPHGGRAQPRSIERRGRAAGGGFRSGGRFALEGLRLAGKQGRAAEPGAERHPGQQIGNHRRLAGRHHQDGRVGPDRALQSRGRANLRPAEPGDARSPALRNHRAGCRGRADRRTAWPDGRPAARDGRPAFGRRPAAARSGLDQNRRRVSTGVRGLHSRSDRTQAGRCADSPATRNHPVAGRPAGSDRVPGPGHGDHLPRRGLGSGRALAIQRRAGQAPLRANLGSRRPALRRQR